MQSGILYGVLAYTAWGLFPLFFKQIAAVDAFEVVLHRTVWSMVFVVGVLTIRRQWEWLSAALRQPRVLATFAASAGLLACNWLVYVWAIANDHVLDASLGYFILPLMNVAMGYVVLKERPRWGQWLAVGVAACGVLWLTWQGGRMPWVALILATTFGIYGLLRKLGTFGRAGRADAGNPAADPHCCGGAGAVDAPRPWCAGGRALGAVVLAAAGRSHHRGSAAAVCGRGTSCATVDHGGIAVHLAEPAVAAGRGSVW